MKDIEEKYKCERKWYISTRLALILDKFMDIDQEGRRDALSLFEQCPNAKVLDLGCGNGDFTLSIGAKIGTKEIFGIDCVQENVEQAKSRGIMCHHLDLDKAQFPFKNESFDVVCASNIIEHLSDTDGFITEIYRVLKPDGYAVISTPNLAAWHIIIYLILGWQPRWVDISDRFFWVGRPHTKIIETTSNKMPTHRRVFASNALGELLECYGFRVEKNVGSALFPLPAPLAKFLLRFVTKRADITTVKIRKNCAK